jgi:AcrR family transcriptional regulator
MVRKRKNESAKRLNREQWLALALDILAREGNAKLRIEQLSRSLGVTRGSFYWHFKSRDDFVQSLAEHWAAYSTAQVIDKVEKIKSDPKKSLFALMEKVIEEDLGRYDLAMRAFSAQEPKVALVVKRVDEQRLAYARSLFFEMGFRRQELETRARTFVCYMAGEHVLFAKESKEEQRERLKERYGFFTRS